MPSKRSSTPSTLETAAGLAFGLAQGVRVGWYFGQYMLAYRLFGPFEPGSRQRRSSVTTADWLGEVYALFQRDWENIQAGLYALPDRSLGAPLSAARRSLRFFRDLPAVVGRRRNRQGKEVLRRRHDALYPRYFLQNFHYQTDGYLSDHSAALYDHQVEVLFAGAADAMRRQALVPLSEFLTGRRASEITLLDLACGTGRFLTFVKATWPRLTTIGLDLSPPYLRVARRRLASWSRRPVLQANVEVLPLADGSIDVATCIYLLHELPPPARKRLAAEVGRVIKPGGRLIVVDSIQPGDRPRFDDLIETFPSRFHEPYFPSYARTDLDALFGAHGFKRTGTDIAFLSKIAVYERAGDQAAKAPAKSFLRSSASSSPTDSLRSPGTMP